MDSKLAQALSRLMEERNLKVTDIAAAAKVERQSVYNWLDGAVPRKEALERLCKFFKLSESELLYGRIEYNSERLVEVIQLVEKMAKANGVDLTSAKKAKLIGLLYERYAAGQPPARSEVAQLVKLAG